MCAGDQRPAQRAAEDVLRPAAAAQEVRLQAFREGVVGINQPWLGFKGRMLRQGHEIKLLGGGFELRDEDLEGVAIVSEREQRTRVWLADEAEKFFPTSRHNQAEELGVVADELILVDGVLL